MPYECQVGLWLNISRQHDRRAAGIIKAVSSTMSGELPREIIAAMAEDDEEAKAATNHFQAMRAMER